MRGFVPVEYGPPAAVAAPATPPLEVPLAAVDPVEPWDARVSLFGDLER